MKQRIIWLPTLIVLVFSTMLTGCVSLDKLSDDEFLKEAGITVGVLTQISPSPSSVIFSNLISQQGTWTPTVDGSLNSSVFTLTNGEHSVIPYPLVKLIPILSKNFPNSGLSGAPPTTIFFKFPPNALCTDLNNFLLKSIPNFLKKLLTDINIFNAVSFFPSFAVDHILL